MKTKSPDIADKHTFKQGPLYSHLVTKILNGINVIKNQKYILQFSIVPAGQAELFCEEPTQEPNILTSTPQ
jgi:hypothetical protein